MFRGAGGLSPDLGDLLVRGRRGARLADLATEDSVLAEVGGRPGGEADGRYAHERALALAVQRAEAGDARHVAALAAAGEALGFAIANLITLFAPPRVLICGRALAMSERLLGAAAAHRRRAAAAEPGRRRRDRRAPGRRRDMGARRGGDDVARALRRDLEHDRPGAGRARERKRKRDETRRRRRHRLRRDQRAPI